MAWQLVVVPCRELSLILQYFRQVGMIQKIFSNLLPEFDLGMRIPRCLSLPLLLNVCVSR